MGHNDDIMGMRWCKSKKRRCARRESNPHGLPHWILSPARLPVPPLALVFGSRHFIHPHVADGALLFLIWKK